MSVSIFPFDSMPAAPRVRPPPLPVLAALAGLVGLVAQVLIPTATSLPDVPPSRVRTLDLTAPRVGEAIANPVIGTRTLFAPARHYTPVPVGAASGLAGTPTVDPFFGSTLVGTARARGFAVALLRDPTGKVRTLRPGDRVGAWRVLGVAPDSASFREGAKVIRLGVGETAQVQRDAGQTRPEVPSQ